MLHVVWLTSVVLVCVCVFGFPRGGVLGNQRGFTFEFCESDLVSGPGVLKQQRDFTFEVCESDPVSGPRGAWEALDVDFSVSGTLCRPSERGIRAHGAWWTVGQFAVIRKALSGAPRVLEEPR